MNDNSIHTDDYIKPDLSEDRKKLDRDELRVRMEEHRGIEYLDKGRIRVNTRIFADYVLRHRIRLFRLDSGGRYIKNQNRHNYEEVSEVTLKKICMEIMDELDDSLYEYVKEERLLGFIDKHAESCRRLEIDDRYLLFPNGIYSIQDMSFDEKFETECWTAN